MVTRNRKTPVTHWSSWGSLYAPQMNTWPRCSNRTMITALAPSGGAPVTQAFAHKIGADGYSPDASGAVAVARRLIGIRDGHDKS